ncbi:MAG TPA: T9SS type A sorting domain-containing protein [Cytophagaceae bacterium]|jgi:hypothetical protein
MKKHLLLIALLILTQYNLFAQTIVNKSGSITSSETWTKNNHYLLTGFVYVVAPAVLTIEAGTVIKGDKTTKGSLIIEKGAKIMAMGTETAPIVFTSNLAKGSRDAGDWGGVIILGNGPTNQTNPTIEGGVARSYGGTNVNDNSGVFKYVRIEFPGIAFTADNEINGLTLGGVGKETEIHHVQVSHSGDDSFEWFGGNVNAKYLIAYSGLDDDFDTDFGYSGNVQYGLVMRDKDVSDIGTTASPGASNAFESDGDANGANSTPLTEAKFANITVFGPLATSASSLTGQGANYRRALHIRRNSSLSVYNSVFMGYPIGLFIDNSGTRFVSENIQGGKLQFMNNLISGTKTVADTLKYDIKTSTYTKTELDNWFRTSMNKAIAENSFLGLPTIQGSANFFKSPTFIPSVGSMVLTGGGALPTGFEASTYRGAFNTTDWTTGWANFDPQNFDYSVVGGPTTGINDPSETNLSVVASPNPIEVSTQISYTLSTSSIVNIDVYDATGNLVVKLENGSKAAGQYSAEFNASGLASGLYFAKVSAGKVVKTIKLSVR